MGNKEQLLLMKLKGQLTFNETQGLENVINTHKHKFTAIGFELSGLNLIDSSGTGFLINQYDNGLRTNQKVKFFFKGEEQEITATEQIIKLCKEMFYNYPLSNLDNNAINNQQNELTNAKNKISENTSPLRVEDAPKKQVSYESYHIDNKTLAIQAQDNEKRAPFIQVFKKTDNIVIKSVYISGIFLALLLIFSLFLPQLHSGNIILGWKYVIYGSAGLGIIGTLIIGLGLLVISLMPGFSLARRAPVMLVFGTAGIILWYHFMSYDGVIQQALSTYLIYKRVFAQLIIASILAGSMLIFNWKNPKSLVSRTILGIMIVFLVAAYIIPFKETKSIILTGIKTRMLVKELVIGIDTAKNLSELVFNMYLLLPLFLGLISILVFFTKKNENNGIAEFCGKALLSFFPVLIFSGAIHAGFNFELIYLTHILFITITLSVFTFLFSKSLYLTFSPDGPNFLYNVIDKETLKKKQTQE